MARLKAENARLRRAAEYLKADIGALRSTIGGHNGARWHETEQILSDIMTRGKERRPSSEAYQ
jgi:hypothetical protein